MHIYYIAGVPYSDELYHHGIKGQKWGLRRFQNEDGTLTALGKIHYGAQKAGQAVGNAAKKVAKYEVDKFKRRHPWTMTNEELDAATVKAKKVAELRNQREIARGKTFLGKLSNLAWKGLGVGVEELGKNIGVNAGKKIVEGMFESEDVKKARMLKEKTDLSTAEKNYRERELQAKKDYDNYKYRRDLYRKSKRLEAKERVKTSTAKAKSVSKSVSDYLRTSKIGSKKAVDEYVSDIVERDEKERRKKLYGPGGTAYR